MIASREAEDSATEIILSQQQHKQQRRTSCLELVRPLILALLQIKPLRHSAHIPEGQCTIST